MAAVLAGQADEVAYSVTEAAGVHWLTPTIWYKEKLKVNVETARAILAQGKKDGTYEAPIPEDNAKAIEEANDLVEMAQTAWDQHVRGPEVEILLRMAADGAEPQETPKEEPPREDPVEQPADTPPDEAGGEEPGEGDRGDGDSPEGEQPPVPDAEGGEEVRGDGEEAPEGGDKEI